MAQQNELKVVLRDGTEDVLKVGDKIIYVEGGHEFKRFGKVVRLTPARAHLERGGYITKDGLVQGIGGSDARYISKRADQCENGFTTVNCYTPPSGRCGTAP